MSPVFFCMKRPFIESHQMGSPFLKVEMKTPTADVIEWLMKNLLCYLTDMVWYSHTLKCCLPMARTIVSWNEVKVIRSCWTLCDPMDGSLTGSSGHGIFQARILRWIAILFSRESSQPRDRTQVSLIAGGFFHLSHQGNLASPIFSETESDLLMQSYRKVLCCLFNQKTS